MLFPLATLKSNRTKFDAFYLLVKDLCKLYLDSSKLFLYFSIFLPFENVNSLFFYSTCLVSNGAMATSSRSSGVGGRVLRKATSTIHLILIICSHFLDVQGQGRILLVSLPNLVARQDAVLGHYSNFSNSNYTHTFLVGF